MNEVARQLNEQIQAENPHVYELLSDLGKELYYPKGILTQTAEANKKAFRFNATIGIATEEGKPMFLPVINESLSAFAPEDLYDYAPPQGKEELRKVWAEKLLDENPSLRGKSFSLPLVTNALTHGLSITADMFLNKDDALVVPEKLWGNYHMIFGTRRDARVVTYDFYTEDGKLNIEAMKKALLSEKAKGKAMLLLNFPNNPTGYTPTEEEANAIVTAVKEVAEEGMNLVILCDDAYFGLFYENSITESLFGRFAGLHPRILPVKVDGPTKEEYVWGFRVGMISFASESQLILDALVAKARGIIRGTISNASHPAQTFVLQALKSSEFKKQKQEKFEILKTRAMKVKDLLNSGRFDDAWDVYPFNSGYFMCVKLKKVNSEQLRKHLLEQYGVGVIALGSTDVRIAFSCVEEKDIEELFDLIYKGAKDLE